jgi:NADPH:quinone reductase
VTGTMRAVVPAGAGGPGVLRIAERPIPVPAAEQIVVRVRAAALNHADLLQRAGEYPAPAGESDILGVEIAGDVVAAGTAVPTPPVGPVFGLVGGGGYADYCVIDHRMAVPIPPALTYAQAAALPEVFLTADTALFQLGGLAAGMRVLVHGGASGVGTASIQLARAVGAWVACTVCSAAKADRAGALGADLVVNHRSQDFVEQVLAWTDGAGVDVIVDIVGADYFTRNLAALRTGGCLVLLGVIGGTVCTVDLDAVIVGRLQVKGTVMRPLPLAAKRSLTERFRGRWLPLVATGELVPVVDAVVPVTEAARAHERMERSEHVGKIVLDLDGARDLAVQPGPPGAPAYRPATVP